MTIRRVAEKIEYSPPTIYEYFESKEALIEELSHEGFRLLLAALRGARDSRTDPLEQSRAMGDAYWNFVWTHPELYQVISGLGGVNFCQEDHEHPHAEGKQVFDLFCEMVQAVLPSAARNQEDVADKVITLWSLFHGFIALLMAGRIPMEERDRARELAHQGFQDLLTTWRSERAHA